MSARFAKGARLDPDGHKVTPLSLHPGVRRAGGELPTMVRAPSAPVMDQTRTNSCVEHAFSAAVSPALGFTASQRVAYDLARLMELADRGMPRSTPLTDNGTAPNELARAVSLYGVRERASSPDFDARNSDVDPATMNEKLREDDFAASGKHLVLGQYEARTDQEMLVALAVLQKPVTVTIFADTRGPRSVDGWDPASGPLGPPDTSDRNGGYHGILIIGCHSVAGKIVWDWQNSWGTSWGNLGFGMGSEAWLASTIDRYVWDCHFAEVA